MTVNVCIADSNQEQPLDAVTIVIGDPLPALTYGSGLAQATEFYQVEARALADALEAALPQGTRHQLLLELLTRHPVLYRGA